MTHKERLTIKYDGLPVPKELCTIDRLGNADDCANCSEICSELFYDCTDNCPVQKCFNKPAELEDKIENGTLIEPSCKVGDTVYQTDGVRIYESKIKNIIYDADHISFDERAINKTVFLTREEAEQALKKEKKDSV